MAWRGEEDEDYEKAYECCIDNFQSSFACLTKDEVNTIDFKKEIGDDGNLHLKENALKKDTVKYQFDVYGKQFTLKFKINEAKGSGGEFR